MIFLRYIILFCLFSCLIFRPELGADTLYLKNGQTIDGMVKQESDTQVVIDVGAGIFTFNKEEIERVEKNDQQKESITSKQLPKDPAEKELNTIVTKARIKRRLIARYNSEKQVQDAKINKVQSKLRPLYKEFEATAEQVGQYEPGEALPVHEWKRAHAALTKRDKTLSQIKGHEIRLSELKEKESEIAKNLGRALAEYSVMNSSMAQLYEVIIHNDKTGTLRKKLQYVKKMIDRYKADWVNETIPLQKIGNSYHVEVQLNDDLFYTFILDTGASAVVITREMASDLGLTGNDEIRTINCKIADGSIVPGRAVMLKSVTVGDMRVENIAAIIMEDVEEKQINPLLGMTYFSNFYFQIDTTAHILILEKYKR